MGRIKESFMDYINKINPHRQQLEYNEMEYYYERARNLKTKLLNENTLEWEEITIDLSHYSGVLPAESDDNTILLNGSKKLIIRNPYEQTLQLWKLTR